ncbi:hypothetical protein DA101_027850 [Sinorhizobium meliloti]|nr:hypothetical protein DA101_027850 [Sinorhizobium meliloti]
MPTTRSSVFWPPPELSKQRRVAIGRVRDTDRIIAATGLRISEAINLRCCDVDIEARCATVRMTKFQSLGMYHFIGRSPRHLSHIYRSEDAS